MSTITKRYLSCHRNGFKKCMLKNLKK
uniref:Uncharacterized protein n=1 Tax=Lepeophtheirus salmonis TaxID=72036 RepID=A0A0K2UV98_LEPSM